MSQIQPILVDTKEAARLLGLKESTLRAWRSKGKGPKFVHVSTERSTVLYPMKELNKWAESLT